MTPKCTSKRFGPRMYCFPSDGTLVCQYCGLEIQPHSAEQLALIEASRHETWWRRDDD
jgi:hypothetical protein